MRKMTLNDLPKGHCLAPALHVKWHIHQPARMLLADDRPGQSSQVHWATTVRQSPLSDGDCPFRHFIFLRTMLPLLVFLHNCLFFAFSLDILHPHLGVWTILCSLLYFHVCPTQIFFLTSNPTKYISFGRP